MAKLLKDLNYLRFKKIDSDRFLLTNDTGHYLFLTRNEFESLTQNSQPLSEDLHRKLFDRYFIDSTEKHEEIIEAYRRKNFFVTKGPGLHIIVVTLRCDHTCIYCHASRKSMRSKEYNMDETTGEKVVDFILESTTDVICIEFQGGEPLANFGVIKHIIEYIGSKKTDKKIVSSVVTNLSLMDDKKLKFLMDNNVNICTSLDGPEQLHNGNRITNKINSYQNTVSWIKKIQHENSKKDEENQKFSKINALFTATSDSLSQYREIIDLYIELGLPAIHLRPLNPFGYGKKLRDSLLYSPEEFLDFYTRSLDYIIEYNKSGKTFFEKTAKIMLTKILDRVDANYLDLRSPCGAGIGQLAYNYDGNIFTCDEGRMVYEMGDDVFLLGNVKESRYSDVMESEVVRGLCVASCLESIPGCNDCVYNPYCGVCPVYNYSEQGSIFGQMPTNDRCKILKGIFDYLFDKIDENIGIFSEWVQSL